MPLLVFLKQTDPQRANEEVEQSESDDVQIYVCYVIVIAADNQLLFRMKLIKDRAELLAQVR